MINKTFFNKRLFWVLSLIPIVLIGNFIAYKIVHIPAQLEMTAILAMFFLYPILSFPKVGIYILFIISPFIAYIRRLYYLQYSRPSIDTLIMLNDILIAYIVIGLIFIFHEKGIFDKNIKKIQMTVSIYLFYLFMRIFLLNILPFGKAILEFKYYGPAILLFFVGTKFATNFSLLKKVWIITIFIGVISFAYAMKQLTLGYSQAEQLWFTSISFTSLYIKGIARPFSFFQSPAAFADYMQLAIIGVMSLAPLAESAFRKYFLYLLLPVFFYGSLLTSVRSNWIGIILSVILFITVVNVTSIKKRILTLVTLGLAFFVINTFSAFVNENFSFTDVLSVIGNKLNIQYADMLITDRTSAILDPFKEHSMLSRIALWKQLIELSVDPILAVFGRGLGALQSDSVYFTYLAEFGYPGMFFIITFQIICIVTGMRFLNKYELNKTSSLIRAVTIMNFVFLIINITGNHINSFPGDIYYWFWNGVMFKLCSEGKNKSYENNGYSGFPA